MNYRAFFLSSSGLLLSGLALNACGVSVVSGSVGGAGGVGGATSTVNTTGGTLTGPETTTATTGTTSTTDATTGVSTGPGPTTTVGSGSTCPGGPPLSGPCAPKASCPANGSQCLSEVDQTGKSTFGLRVAHLDFAQPAALTKGLVASVFANSAAPNQPACNVNGSGTFSWLLRFDAAAGTVTTGGAKPSMSPSGPYQFVDEVITSSSGSVHVAPVTLSAPLSGCAFSSSAGDFNLPLYLDTAATQAVVLPMHQAHFHDGAVSDDHGCIGAYNAAGLDPANSCIGDTNHPTFIDGAYVDGFFNLEESDHILISSLNESLCVLFSGNSSQFGTQNASGVTVCKRDASNGIVFKGDWCTATNQAGGCQDALRFSASFAAQGVIIQ